MSVLPTLRRSRGNYGGLRKSAVSLIPLLLKSGAADFQATQPQTNRRGSHLGQEPRVIRISVLRIPSPTISISFAEKELLERARDVAIRITSLSGACS